MAPPAACPACGEPFDGGGGGGGGAAVAAAGALWHARCLACAGCGASLCAAARPPRCCVRRPRRPPRLAEGRLVASVAEGRVYHAACAVAALGAPPHCAVCGAAVSGGAYARHPAALYYRQAWCAWHGRRPAKCCACERLQPDAGPFAALHDGRRLCLECLGTAVVCAEDAAGAAAEVERFFGGVLGVPVVPGGANGARAAGGSAGGADDGGENGGGGDAAAGPTGEAAAGDGVGDGGAGGGSASNSSVGAVFDVHLVDEAEIRRRVAACAPGGASPAQPAGEARGLCLGETTAALRVVSARRGGEEGSGGGEDIGEGVGVRVEEKQVTLVRRGSVSAVLVLFGLPWLLTGAVLAHEFVHAHLRLSACRRLDPVVEEGLCELASWLFLEWQRGRPAGGHIPPPACHQHHISEQTDAVYGRGFRAARAALEAAGGSFAALVEAVKATGGLDVTAEPIDPRQDVMVHLEKFRAHELAQAEAAGKCV